MSINHACVNYLIKRNDWGTLYSYFSVFESVCKSAIEQKEANYYVGQIDWLKSVIQSFVDNTKIEENVAFAGIVEHISLLYLDIILESSKYFSNLDINAISKSVIKGIDTGKRYNSIKAIRGRNYIEIYKKMITEVYAEGHRITPDWLIKQYVAKEEFVYVNTLFDMVKEGVEQAYSLSSFFVEKNMYYEACIMLTRFYEYESKFSCGGGAFLIAAYKVCKDYGIKVKLVGVDVDPIAIMITRSRLTEEHVGNNAQHIILGNPLLTVSNSQKSTKAFSMALSGRYYNSDLAIDISESYDVVIGNPPWEKIRFEEKNSFLTTWIYI